MKIISWNVNGFRAVVKKGFWDWLKKTQAEVVCLQEIKTQEIKEYSGLFRPPDYFLFINPAKKKGYSGVAVFSKKKPAKVLKSLGLERFDNEGRILELVYPQFTLLALYLPHGGRDKSNLGYKLASYQALLGKLRKMGRRKLILAGDFNIAHTDLDLARPDDNRNNIMFTPEERKQLDKIVNLGFVDSFRQFHKEGGHYTWWPYRLNARERNLGWRIDYIFVSDSLAPKLKDAYILSEVTLSDHCPVGIEIP